jgi:hypothetical protein
MSLEKFSFGIGDRFGREGKAQLMAIREINRLGVPVVPVWNKSNREHELVGTTQASVKAEAEEAVANVGWDNNYYVDADHITFDNVDKFIDYSNFFTLDVAHSIGKPADPLIRKDFIDRNKDRRPMTADSGWNMTEFSDQFLSAIHEVKRLYDYISSRKPGGFIPEVSMDEVAVAQSPTDLYFILKELKHLGVEVQTIAPKFTGLFPKGVDYEGDVDGFASELEQDILILKRASDEFGLPENLKLSIHSGSDKFSIYPAIRELVKKHNVGIHIKTAGTTWLEEVIGLARGGGEGLRMAKEIYSQGIARFDELAGPYATVLHINKDFLPPVKDVLAWNSARFAHTLIHDQSCKDYNPHFRQLIHISYKVAAEMGSEFTGALDYYRTPIEEQVYTNLVERHLKRVF